MFGLFKKVKSKTKSKPPVKQKYTPLELSLHDQIVIEPSTAVYIPEVKEQLFSELRNSFKQRFTIDAIDTLKEEGDTRTIYNLYVIGEDEQIYLIQLHCEDVVEMNNDGEYVANEHIREAMFYCQPFEDFPTTTLAWEQYKQDLGTPTMEFDGITYTRCWHGDKRKDERVDIFDDAFTFKGKQLSKIDIAKHKNDPNFDGVSVTYQYLLYTRKIESDMSDNLGTVTELLLISIEETSETAVITMNVGLNCTVKPAISIQ